MTFFNSFLTNSFHKNDCFYVNATSKIQIIRITNIPHLYWERVVFPGQRIIFETVAEAKLEVHTSECITAILADVISCQKLRFVDTSTSIKSPGVASLS